MVTVLPADRFMLDHRVFQAQGLALLDPAQLDQEQWADLPGEVVVPARHASQSHLFPRLIELDQLSFVSRIGVLDRMEAWQRRRDTPFFDALLTSASEPRHVRHHLASRMLIRHPDGDSDVLRFYDPRVFRHLRWILDAEQMARLLGPISRWSWREPDGTWMSYLNQARVPLAHLGQLNLSPRQWGSLQRVGEINQGLAVLARKEPALHDDVVLASSLDALLALAWTDHRLIDREDRWLYAEQATRFGDGIQRHPALQQRLRSVQNDASTYVGACADLNDDAMRQMASELLPI